MRAVEVVGGGLAAHYWCEKGAREGFVGWVGRWNLSVFDGG